MHWVDHEKEHVTFRGKYPSVLAIPSVMESYPGYTYGIIPWEDFMEKYNVKD